MLEPDDAPFEQLDGGMAVRPSEAPVTRRFGRDLVEHQLLRARFGNISQSFDFRQMSKFLIEPYAICSMPEEIRGGWMGTMKLSFT